MVRRIIYPPIWLVISLVTIFFLNEYYPGLRFTSLAWQIVGGGVILIGLVLLVVSNGLFVRAKTGVIPFRGVSALVTSGIYRYTRNPMYLGMAAVLLGCSLTVGAVYTLPIAPLFMIIIEMRFIRPEEDMLRGIFGQEYTDYCARVRRWL